MTVEGVKKGPLDRPGGAAPGGIILRMANGLRRNATVQRQLNTTIFFMMFH
jgi:hypothetical protein